MIKMNKFQAYLRASFVRFGFSGFSGFCPLGTTFRDFLPLLSQSLPAQNKINKTTLACLTEPQGSVKQEKKVEIPFGRLLSVRLSVHPSVRKKMIGFLKIQSQNNIFFTLAISKHII